jgi:hypothetical protein
MGMIQIQISDDVKAALEKAYPGETIEAAAERWLRERAAVDIVAKPHVTKSSPKGRKTPEEVAAFMEDLRKFRECTPSTSDEEIWALRQELRS